MAEVKAIHECLFCPQTFDTAAAKDDHTLEHFAQETCLDCNRNMLRIGGSLYVKHDTSICSVKMLKTENTVELPSIISAQDVDSQCVSYNTSSHMEFESIKSEPQNVMEDSNESIDFDSLDKLDSPLNSSSASENNDDDQSITSDIECKLVEMFCKEDTQISPEQTEQSDKEPKNVEIGADNSNKNDSVNCEICGKLISCKKNLKIHKTLKHPSPDLIYCKRCARLFTTIEDRDTHRVECDLRKKLQNDKRSNLNLRCDLCDKLLKSDGTYRQHMQRVHQQRVISFKCVICKARFLKESWLQQHECTEKLTQDTQINSKQTEQINELSMGAVDVADNTNKNNRVECDICGKLISNKKNLPKHKILMHPSPDMLYCNRCGRLFTTIEDRDTHRVECAEKQKLRCQKYKSKLSDSNLRCDICDKPFESDAYYCKHMLRVHKKRITKFNCVKCNAKFLKESSLQQHKCIEKPNKFECDFCTKVYAVKGDLQRHLLTKHNSNIDNFKCKLCGQIFASLQNHKCKGKKKNPPHLRELIPCDTCGKIVTRGAMRTHQLALHSSSGIIFCRACYKTFPNNDDLISHDRECKMKIIRGEESACDVCGKIMSKRNVAKHKLSVHSAPGTIFCRTCVKKFDTTEELNAHKPECTLKRKLYKQNQLAENSI